MIAVLVTADTPAGDAELLSQRHAFMTLGAALSSNCRGSRGLSVRGGVDFVNAMAVSAGRRSGHAAQDGLTVNTLHKLRALTLVTLPASRWDVNFGNRRFGIRRGLDVMTVVAICADSGVAVAVSNSPCMNAFPIRQEGPFADAASLHHGFIAVTPAASLSNIRTVDR